MAIDENSKKFWEMAEPFTMDSANEVTNGGGMIGVGLDINSRTVVLSVRGQVTDFTIEEARAMAYGLELAADGLQAYISDTN